MGLVRTNALGSKNKYYTKMMKKKNDREHLQRYRERERETRKRNKDRKRERERKI